MLALGIWLRREALNLPFQSDDYIQLALLKGSAPIERAPWNLYDFFRALPAELELQRAGGTLPWWSDDQVHGAVFRPLRA